jgi:hypothetical protein
MSCSTSSRVSPFFQIFGDGGGSDVFSGGLGRRLVVLFLLAFGMEFFYAPMVGWFGCAGVCVVDDDFGSQEAAHAAMDGLPGSCSRLLFVLVSSSVSGLSLRWSSMRGKIIGIPGAGWFLRAVGFVSNSGVWDRPSGSSSAVLVSFFRFCVRFEDGRVQSSSFACRCGLGNDCCGFFNVWHREASWKVDVRGLWQLDAVAEFSGNKL